ncbi:amidohydrolase [Subtercola lobariae]|uniref:Amidohydrolase n=1 Tax=Subtercola lobariae TaxID=1588641 RepID=A0A917BHR7_9MICO|nr:amidohydrolase family protein [Subtercola lobariae]GGF39737.1 amidohydrolase [Subtercola lobariae]
MTDDVFLRRGRIPGHDGECDVLLADSRVRAIVPSGLVRAPAGAATIDLDGRFVIPGLWDNHVHFTQWSLLRRRIDLGLATSATDLLARLRSTLNALDGAPQAGGVGSIDPLQASSSSATPAAITPLIGYGVRDSLWPDTNALTATLLDTVSGERPVVLSSADLHGCWLNSAALAFYGLRGRPTGRLREDDCFALLRRLDDVPDLEADALVADAARAAARLGVVGVVDLEMRDNLTDWRRRIASGIDSLRVAFGIYSEHLESSIEAGLRTGEVIPDTAGLLTVGPFKIITDGSLNTRTAYCFDEYEGLEGQAHSHGLLTVAPDALLIALERASTSGLTPAVHAIGDHANALALDVFARLGSGGRIEHAQLVSDSDFSRFAELGVTASVQPEHAMDDRDVADRYWNGRTDRAFAFESLRASGAALLLGSDAPVAPLDPWQTMAAAVGRSRDGRPAWHAEQRISAQAALTASTNRLASIGVGMAADLAVVERDPLTSPADDLRAMPVAATFLAGRATHLAL